MRKFYSKILYLITTILATAMIFSILGCEQPKTSSLAGDKVYQGETFASKAISAASVNAPTGRTASFIIAASDSAALEKAQANAVCTGISTLTATLSGAALVSPSSIASGTTAATEVTVSGSGTVIVTLGANQTGIATSGTSTVTSSPKSLVAGANTITVTDAGIFYISGMGDESVINSAILTLATSGNGGIIQFLSGNYYIYSQILYRNSDTFKGCGIGSTKLHPVNQANCPMFQYYTAATSMTNSMCRWYNLLLDGNSANNTSGSGIYEANYMHDPIFNDCYFHDFKTFGMYITGGWNISVTDCIFEMNQYAGYFASGQDIRISNSKALINYYAFFISSCKDPIIENCFFQHTASLTYWTHSYDIRLDGTTSRARIVNNSFDEAVETGNVACISLFGSTGGSLISGNTFAGHSSISKAITDYVTALTGGRNEISNNVISGFTNNPPILIGDSPTYVDTPLIINNQGCIGIGEIRTYSGSITAGNANTFAFAWQNPEAQKVLVTEVQVEITTPGETGSSVLDVGTAANATTHNDNFLDGVDLNTTAVYDSMNTTDKGTNGVMKPVLVDENGGTTDYVTGQILVANAASLSGKYYIMVIGR